MDAKSMTAHCVTATKWTFRIESLTVKRTEMSDVVLYQWRQVELGAITINGKDLQRIIRITAIAPRVI